MSSTVRVAMNVDKVWHTGNGVSLENGGPEKTEDSSCRKKKVILVSWDRNRGILFLTLSVCFVVWAAIYFPLIVK